MDRVFLDANVLFAAAYAPGSGLTELWRRPGARLLASGYVIEEARRNLDNAAARDRLEALLEGVEPVGDPAAPLDPTMEKELPESDRPVLRAAMAAGATHLLSGDRRAFGAWYGKRLAGLLVLRPAEYLKQSE
ncbi:MAG: PIN domain-containing protein [Thermoanaerobaculia bacterium]|nr:PIN domain-containing protein [Thermoanaerobaculia bacterium]